MATRALLLSRDEQAVDALTEALGALDCDFDHSSETTFGIKRLGKRRFDVILVDCESEQNATQVFDSVRRSTLNRESITIAVVDGKSGVTGAFRLGTNLVVTKPVSLEQAKITLRTAIGRLPKESRADKVLLERRATVPGRNAVFDHPVCSPAGGNEPTQRPRDISGSASMPRSPQALAGSSLASRLRVEKKSVSSSSPGCPSTTYPPMVGAHSSLEQAPLSTDGVEAKEIAAPEGTRASARRINTEPEDDDPILAELRELKGIGSVLTRSAFDVPEKRRRSNAPLVVAAIGLLLATGLYLAWTTQPKVRELVGYEYQAVRGRVAGYRKQPPASINPAQPPLRAANNGVPSPGPPAVTPPVEAVDSNPSSLDLTGEAAPADGSATSAKALPRDSPSQDVQQDNPKDWTGVVAPATSRTERFGVDINGPLVLPEKVADGNVVRRVRPVYPNRAKQKRVQGTVKLGVIIDMDGKVDSVHTLDGDPVLAQAAVDAVKHWRYKPFLHNNKAVVVETRVSVVFHLPR